MPAGPRSAARLFPAVEDSCEITVSIDSLHYSASALARAVEDAEAHLLNLNLTTPLSARTEAVIEIRVSHRSAMAVCRSLERYGFNVIDVRSADDPGTADTLRRRADELLHLLEL